MSEQDASSEEAEPTPAADEPSSDAAAADVEEKPKKKKKKKAEVEAVVDPALVDPRATQLAAAFDAGDFVRVRELATELSKTDDAALNEVGRDYLARIAVDPIQIAFLGACAVAILTIAWIYIPH